MGEEQVRIGFACAWWRPRAHTWSYTANRVREALELDRRAVVVDLEAQRSLPVQAGLVAVARVRRRSWELSPLNRKLAERAVRRQLARDPVDVVLALGETDPPGDRPGWCYRDLDWGLALEEVQRGNRDVNVPRGASEEALEAMGRRQLEAARRATGVLAMSDWYGRWLVSQGVAPERIVTVGAGLNTTPARRGEEPNRDRLLFVGADFHRKGGDLVVEACRRLRATGARPVSLTIVGPVSWPLASSPPDWVDFRAQLPPHQAAALYPQHDAFVLPSRFEAYGIALLEARSAGLPCVARDAMAMPELVPPRAGRLVGTEDPDELAGAIDAVLGDDELADAVRAEAPTVRRDHDWRMVASRIVDRIRPAG